MCLWIRLGLAVPTNLDTRVPNRFVIPQENLAYLVAKTNYKLDEKRNNKKKKKQRKL